MKYNFSINIKEVVEYSFGHDERKELIEFITYDCMTKEARKDYLSKLLNDLLETEHEFDKRPNVIEAMNTIIKAIE